MLAATQESRLLAMGPRLRRLGLTAHITFSVGWIGAVAGFLALSIAGLWSTSNETARSAYIAMDLVGRFVIVPMSLVALATGLIQSLGTKWGLFRHYWVLVKFLLTLFATIALMLHQFTAVAEAARLASAMAIGALPSSELHVVGKQLVADSSLALVLLLTTTALAVYKPWGPTSYGRRLQSEVRRGEGRVPTDAAVDPGLRVFVGVIGALVLSFVIAHLTGHGLGHHGH
jgi:hypothetical protein